MNIAYFGSPLIAAELLEGLVQNNVSIKLVATQPDRPAGKHLEIQETETKKFARKQNIKIFDKDLKESFNELKNILISEDIELCIVYAYGGYIPSSILAIPRYGFINIHPSLLPCYRGPSPTAYSLILGDSETGTTIIQLNEELDGGDIISQEKILINKNQTRLELEKILTNLGLELILKYINNITKGKVNHAQKQNSEKATITSRLTKGDGYINLSVLKKAIHNETLNELELPDIIQRYYQKYPQYKKKIFNSAEVIYNLYRGLYGWPGIWTTIQTKVGERRLKFTRLNFDNNKLNLVRVQLEGKNEVDFPTFNKAYAIFK